MAEDSKIEWTHHTFNPWTGCTKVSAACDHCYAEAWSKRSGHVEWGPHGQRRRTKTWGNPVKWNKRLEGTGRRERVFCASLADVFDNHKSIQPQWRDDLYRLITDTPNLDWLLLTKRPQNISRFVSGWCGPMSWPRNVWIGTTIENREEMLRRGPHLAKLKGIAPVTFWSCEPLVGGLGSIPPEIMPTWLITGGESGANFRPADPNWFRSLRDQCRASGVPFLFKQWEGRTQPIIKSLGRKLDGVVHDGYPVVA